MKKNSGWAIAAAVASVIVSGASLAQTSSLSDNSYKITLPGAQPAFSWQEEHGKDAPGVIAEPRTEMLFRLTAPPTVETDPGSSEVDDNESRESWSSDVTYKRIDFLQPDELKMQDINHGLSYSAGFEIETSKEFSNQSQFISSRQLGLHYGRLGPANYSGVELSFRQFVDEAIDDTLQDDKDLWSLGMTTGRRFALTGLDSTDPLWTVSLRGQFSRTENQHDNISAENQLWYLSPGLYWDHDSFRLSADLLMPFLQSGLNEHDTDYRVRAKIQKRF